MPQVFHPSTNTIARLTIFGSAFLLAGVVWLTYVINASAYVTNAGVVPDQPVPFSHEHHVTGLGIHCRYCHEHVEESSFAGIPPTKTCMSCHSRIWTGSPMLEPVRASYRSGRPLEWIRVHDLPDFVYFDHHIHIAKGVGCETCHGRVDRMSMTWKAEPFQMEWCLDCHRQPEQYVRPRESIYEMGWSPEGDRIELGRRLVRDYEITRRTNCSICHR